jgi:saccharopine dehydrogenase (NAD+, L-lysine-forming)
MRILIVGAGGVGSALVSILAHRHIGEQVVVADVDPVRSRTIAERHRDVIHPRVTAASVDASSRCDLERLMTDTQADVVVNACDPRFNPPIFDATFATRATYIDMAMHLSRPHPTNPHEEIGVMLGAEQLEASSIWARHERLALVAMGVEPGLSDVFARYAADHLFDRIDEIGVRDGNDLHIAGYDFAPTFSVWTTIEECLNPPIVYERERGWFTTAPFSEPEVFTFPDGIGPLTCFNVEHEEVVLMPRWLDVARVTFKYGLGDDFVDVLRTLHRLGLDRTDAVDVRGSRVSPRDVVAAVLPDPAKLGDQMTGRTCAGTWVKGRARDGRNREIYLHHIVDNEWSMRVHGHQAVVWQTALHPAIALELIEDGTWSGVGVLGPEAFDSVPFLERLADSGAPWALEDRTPRLAAVR